MKNRRKKNRSLLPLTTGLCLLPLALSLALYPALPNVKRKPKKYLFFAEVYFD